jgi:MFS family permease
VTNARSSGDDSAATLPAVSRLRGLWRHADFMRLWTAAGISAAGNQVTFLALPLTAILVLHASAFEVAAISTAVTLPNLLGIAAGVWLDRVRRRRVMIAADFGRAAVLASVPVAYVFGLVDLKQLYVVALISGTLNVFFEIASQAYLPSIVGRERLVEANAKLQGLTVAADSAGPSIAGALVTLVSAPMAILADAVSFLVSGLLIGSISKDYEPPQEPSPRATTRGSELRELREGARYVFSEPHLRPLLLSHSLANLALGLLFANLLVYAVRMLGLSAAMIGAIFSFANIGGFAGAVFARRIAERAGVGQTVITSFFLFGPAALLLATATTESAVVFVGLGWTLQSFARSLYGVSATSLRQALVPDRLQARVSGVTATTGTSAFPLGTLVGGALAAAFGVREAMLIAATVSFLPFLPVVVSRVRSLREIPDPRHVIDQVVD